MTDEEMKNDHVDETSDDVVFEDTAEGEGEAFSKDKIRKLREELKEAKAKEREYLTAWQRERADFLNYKKEDATRLARTGEHARERIVEDLLPVLDAYDLAFSNKEAWEKVEKNWRMGVEYIHAQLLKVLAENGVTPIETKVGDAFDANLHEPMDTVETDEEGKDHTIAAISQQGYKIGDRILRPARVKVFEYKKID
jgi:molecular chaperone GrpE